MVSAPSERSCSEPVGWTDACEMASARRLRRVRCAGRGAGPGWSRLVAVMTTREGRGRMEEDLDDSARQRGEPEITRGYLHAWSCVRVQLLVELDVDTAVELARSACTQAGAHPDDLLVLLLGVVLLLLLVVLFSLHSYFSLVAVIVGSQKT